MTILFLHSPLRPSHLRSIGAAFLVCAVIAFSAHAAPAFAGYDKPISTKTATSKDGQESICTDYGDVAVIESRDGPSAAPARLVAGDGARCGAAAAKRGRELPTADMGLEGRAGPVLIFTQMDAHGAVDFTVVRLRDGQVLVKEAVVGDPAFKSVTVRRDGSVVMTYRRGVNAPCSLYQNARACWAQMVKEGSVPREMAEQAPQESACKAAYAAMSAPRDAPSIAEWEQETTIDHEGPITKRVSGVIGCGVLP
jgi:hypothetical protein